MKKAAPGRSATGVPRRRVADSPGAMAGSLEPDARSPRLEDVLCRAWSCMGRHRDGGWELYVQRWDWSAFQHRLFQAGAAHATPSRWLEYILPLRLTLEESGNTICARYQVGRTIESDLAVNVHSSPNPPASNVDEITTSGLDSR